MTDAEETYKVLAGSLRKPGFVMIKGQPCKITEINQKSKATVRGNEKIHLVGTHMFTGKKYEDTILTAAQVDAITLTRTEYPLLDVDTNTGIVSVLIPLSGDTKEDLNLEKNDSDPNKRFNDLGEDLIKRFEAGDPLKVVVQAAMGKEIITEVLEDK